MKKKKRPPNQLCDQPSSSKMLDPSEIETSMGKLQENIISPPLRIRDQLRIKCSMFFPNRT